MSDRAEDCDILSFSRLMHELVINQDVEAIETHLNDGFPINARLRNTGAFDNFPTEVEYRHFVAEVLTRTRSRKHSAKEKVKVEKTATLLHLAVLHKSDLVINLLLDRGADVNSPMEGGETALMIACITKQHEVAEMLIEKGANVEAETLWGKRALHYAARYGEKQTCKLLLVNAADADGGYVKEDDVVMPKRAPSAESLQAVESLADSEDCE